MAGPKTNERPGTRAQHKFAQGSASKARRVLDLIRNKPVDEAIEILTFSDTGVSETILKVLNSAIANAEHNDEIPGDELFVSACYADEGPTGKRWRPRARGRATRIRKRTAHITIIVSRFDADDLEARRERQASRTGTSAAQAEARRRRVSSSRSADAVEDDAAEEATAAAGAAAAGAAATGAADAAAEEATDAVDEAAAESDDAEDTVDEPAGESDDAEDTIDEAAAESDDTAEASEDTVDEPAGESDVADVADDLTNVNGIGPVFAEKLGAAGITSFAALAALDDATKEQLSDDLDVGDKIDGWIEQAKELENE